MRYENERKKAEIHEKYLPKTQRIIDVLVSCETPEQVKVCEGWANRLFNQWEEFEVGKPLSLREILAVRREFMSLQTLFETTRERTKGKNEE